EARGDTSGRREDPGRLRRGPREAGMQGGGTAAWAAGLGRVAAWAAARAPGHGGQLAALAVVGAVLLAPLPLVQGQASTPSFAAATSFAVGTGPFSVAVADVNGDGRPDLLAANQGSNSVSVLLNQTAPGATTPIFSAAADFSVGTTPRSVAAADVNGDGL